MEIKEMFHASRDLEETLDASDVSEMIENAMDSYLKNATLTPASDVDVNGVITSIYLNSIIFCILIASYEILRRKFPDIYNGRHRHVVDDCTIPYELPEGSLPFKWMMFVIKVPWQCIRERCGLDAYMFLRYIRMCLRITFVSGFWGIIILWPVYYFGGGDAVGWYHVSMANIEENSELLWVPVGFIWVFSYFVYFTMEKEYRHFLKLRMEFLGKDHPGTHPQHHYSILLEKIPPELRDDFALKEYFERLFPDKVHSASIVLNLPDLENMLIRRNRVIHRLEKSVASYEATGSRPMHRVGQPRLLCCGVQTEPISICTCCMSNEINDEENPPRTSLVDSIKYYAKELRSMNENLLLTQTKVTRPEVTETTSAHDWLSKIIKHRSTGQLESHENENGENSDQFASDSNENGEQKQSYGALSKTTTPFESDKSEPLLPSPNGKSNVKNIQNKNDGPRPRDGDLFKSITLYDASDHPDLHQDTFTAISNNLGIDFVKDGLDKMNEKVDKIVDEVIGQKTSSTGFVTFSDLATTACASTANLTEKPEALLATVAPEPRDIMWSNAHIPISDVKERKNLTNVLFGFGAILWSAPLTLVQAFATAEQLAKIQGLGWILSYDNGALKAFINGYLPVVALLVLIMLLPIIFEFVATKYEKCKTFSGIQNSILTRYFYYQLANIYITVTAGSLLKSLGEILDHPQTILSMFGKSLPTVVGYFVALLVTKILAGLPMVLLRSGALVRLIFLRTIFTKKFLSQREIDEVYRPQYLLYGWEYPTQLLVIVICFTYTCISPVILPVGAIYFGFAFIVYKKQIMYLYTPRFESGGASFPLAMHRTLVGMICGQITLIGYFFTASTRTVQGICVMPLILITSFKMTDFRKRFVKPSRNLSLERAKEIDTNSNYVSMRTIMEPFEADVSSSFNVHAYRQPCVSEGIGEPQSYRHGKDDELKDEISNLLNTSALKKTFVWGRRSKAGSTHTGSAEVLQEASSNSSDMNSVQSFG